MQPHWIHPLLVTLLVWGADVAEAQVTIGGSSGASAQADAGEPEEEDSRTRLFYLEASSGYSWVDLAHFKQNNLVPEASWVRGEAMTVGAGAGLFVGAFTLGMQSQFAFHDAFTLGTVVADIGFRIPTDHIQPYLRFGAGYAFLRNVDHGAIGMDPNVRDIGGLVVDAGAGFNVTIGDVFSFGVGANFEAFSLKRDAQPRDGIIAALGAVDFDPAAEGSSVGMQVTVMASMNLHF